MNQPLTVSIGGVTDKGVKPLNQDFIGYTIPTEPMLSSKGITLAIADGISSSQVSQIASKTAISSFLSDYYCTSESWSVKNSAIKVIKSINHWLYSQTRNSPYRFNKDKGYVCTFSALVIKSNTAHLFHCGDSRIYRLSGKSLEQLTCDHRRIVSKEVSYLSRALGIDQTLEIDYQQQAIEQGDIFVLATDGIYEFIRASDIARAISSNDNLQLAAQHIIEQALSVGSDDNLSVQLVRIDNVPNYQLDEIHQLTNLPLPKKLTVRSEFDGYQILREIYISSRSHVFLAKDINSQQTVVIKTPSTEMRTDPKYLERFMLEEWIAKRIDNIHVAKAITLNRKRRYQYLVSEYIDGTSLHQWMIDNPKPSLEQVREIIEQIAKGLQAFHRQEMLHQDLRPQNIMIDKNNTVKIIDFGSVFIAGVTNIKTEEPVRGTIRFSAPEYFLGQIGSERSDLFSLAVITYQLLSGKLPYSGKVAQTRTAAEQRKLSYRSLVHSESSVPPWIDQALQKALHVNPEKRYSLISEFIADLRQPNKHFLSKNKPPLLERDPVMFWQIISVILFITLLVKP